MTTPVPDPDSSPELSLHRLWLLPGSKRVAEQATDGSCPADDQVPNRQPRLLMRGWRTRRRRMRMLMRKRRYARYVGSSGDDYYYYVSVYDVDYVYDAGCDFYGGG